MSHRDLTGVSPRFAVCLSLSDTLYCLDEMPIRTKTPKSHVIIGDRCRVEIFSPYNITVQFGKNGKVEKFRGPEEAKRHLISKCNI